MKSLKFILVGASMALALPGYAQYATDALNFSRTQYGSTARMKAVGGAFNAIGGDLSSISGNPAGMGFFTRSEFSITPQYTSANNNALFLGNNTSANKDNVNLNNLAAAWYIPATRGQGQDKTKGWLSFNFGLGVSRTNDFTSSIGYSGTNTKNSIADDFAEQAEAYGQVPNNLGNDIEGDAYDNGLIIDNPVGTNKYEPATDVNSRQTQSSIRSGGQSEINLAFGANYSNTLYLGAAIGVATLRYNFDGVYDESGYNNFRNENYSTRYSQSQRTSGTGVNAKLGMIYKPVQQFRIGATITTPTWYSIDDNYTQGLQTTYPSSGQINTDPNQYDLNYRLKTPWKYTGGAAVFLNQYGFISADIDYVDYTTMRLSNYDASTDQQQIGQNYKSAINYRLGAEFNIKNAFFLRGGYNVSGNPYKNLNDNDFSTKIVSGGLGYRFQQYYIDVTYQNVKGNDFNQPYIITSSYQFYNASGPNPVANVSRKTDNVFLTFGARF